ncbi:hypothetical protein JTB14_035310 [Gonioctena quinquepunctata]|nr:hypothetical protein JTB14_035310 [Gonioctena quinquepunctata]
MKKESAEVDRTENSKTFNHVAEQAELNKIEKNIRQPILCMSNKMNFATEVERGSCTNDQEINKTCSTEAEVEEKHLKNDKDHEINIINVTVLKEATGKENISNDIKDNVEPIIKDVCSTHLSWPNKENAGTTKRKIKKMRFAIVSKEWKDEKALAGKEKKREGRIK